MLDESFIDGLLNDVEGDYFDFKQEHHENQEELIHDILCLANAEHKGDRYLIFGITNSKQPVGIMGDSKRRTDSMVHDILAKAAKFNLQPVISLKPLAYRNITLDVLVIKNRPYKPYYLLKDLKFKKSSTGKKEYVIKAKAIYSRTGSKNTATDDSAVEQLDRMYRERFGLDKSALERFKIYLRDPNRWSRRTDERGLEYYFYEEFPEFTICQKTGETEPYHANVEPWLLHYDAKKEEYLLKYHSTVIYDVVLLLWVDNNYYTMIQPDRKLFDGCYFVYYYLIDSIKFLVNELMHSKNYVERRFFLETKLPRFENEETAEIELTEDFYGSREKFKFHKLG